MYRGRKITVMVTNNSKKFKPNDKYEKNPKRLEIIENWSDTGNGIEKDLNRLDCGDTLNSVNIND